MPLAEVAAGCITAANPAQATAAAICTPLSPTLCRPGCLSTISLELHEQTTHQQVSCKGEGRGCCQGQGAWLQASWCPGWPACWPWGR